MNTATIASNRNVAESDWMSDKDQGIPCPQLEHSRE